MDLVQAALDGERRALARLLSWVENGTVEGQAALARLFPHSGRAHIVGITGAPGAGKSTLVNRLAYAFRQQDLQVAVVAVDPSSPFSGGALLGDRLRMRDLVNDPGIFIRSMASRGHPGGIAHATRDVVTVLDAVGVPLILVETVGAGQAQVDVARVAHTVVLVEAPGMGDDIQALKAGLMEVANIIVVNKSDRPEARQTVSALKSVRLSSSAGHHGAQNAAAHGDAPTNVWETPILQTSALENQGISELIATIQAHREYLESSGAWHSLREQQARAEVDAWLHRHFNTLLQKHVATTHFDAAVDSVMQRTADPASAAGKLLDVLAEQLKNEEGS